MNLDRGSILSFTPTDPDRYWVTFKGEVDTWTRPVVGFATVVTYAAKDEGDRSDARLTPVLLDEDGHATPLLGYLNNWEPQHLPDWRLHHQRPQESTCPAGCGKDSIYMAALDRNIHADGTDNRTCWRRIAVGEV